MRRLAAALVFALASVCQAETIYYYRPRLTDHIVAQVESRIAPPEATKEIFASQDHVTPAYVRSSTCWIKDIDLTCASPWNSDGGTTKAGTLISPRHILFAAHFAISNGATIRFVKMDNTVVSRTLTAQTVAATDVVVGLLDSDVPAGINFARVVPAVAHTMITEHTPRLTLDQEEKALILDIALPQWWTTQPLVGTRRRDFYETIISGDSGNPGFIVIKGEAVLSFAGGAGDLHLHIPEINAAMTALGGGYQVTPVDLSEFVGGN